MTTPFFPNISFSGIQQESPSALYHPPPTIATAILTPVAQANVYNITPVFRAYKTTVILADVVDFITVNIDVSKAEVGDNLQLIFTLAVAPPPPGPGMTGGLVTFGPNLFYRLCGDKHSRSLFVNWGSHYPLDF